MLQQNKTNKKRTGVEKTNLTIDLELTEILNDRLRIC